MHVRDSPRDAECCADCAGVACHSVVKVLAFQAVLGGSISRLFKKCVALVAPSVCVGQLSLAACLIIGR